MTGALAKLSAACRALEQAKTVEEVLDLRDQAEAVLHYMKKRDFSLAAMNDAAELKLRAERKLGALLGPAEDNKGGRPKKPFDDQRVSSPKPSYFQKHCWRQVASVPERVFEDHLATVREAEKVLTTDSVLKLAKERRNEQRRNGKPKDQGMTCTVDDLAKLAGKQFQTILADPPWQYGNQATRASTDNHYGTMTVEQICALPIRGLAAKQAHLWLWTTNGFLFECPRIFEAWGFEFKSSYVWVKPQMGIGNYLRNAHEFLLLAVRGGMVGLAKDVLSWGQFDRGEHSAKPHSVRREVVEKVSPPPRLELFGRQTAEGWTVWGNQITKDLFDANIKEM